MRAVSVLLLWVCALVSSCGGGGGGATSGGGGSGAPPTTGLVPAAPALGAVIHADAAVLRVLRPGASWTYRGVDRPDAGGLSFTVYENVVTHTTASVGVDERASNSLNEGADSRNIRLQGGSVLEKIDLSSLGIAGAVIDAAELRSPVRTNDQYTVFDQRTDGAIADIDGDGKREALDLAIYVRVLGEETVDLLQRPGTRAVRVETAVLARARLSLNGQLGDIVSAKQNVWYAPNVGIVKVSSDVPNDNVPTLRHLTAEELVSWDGLTEGIGALPAVAGVGPSGSNLEGRALGAAVDGVSFGSHAVLRVLNGPVVNVALARVDPGGRVTQATAYPLESLDGQLLFPRQLLGAGGGLRLIYWSARGLVMVSYDSSGQQRLTGTPVTLAGVPGSSSGDGADVVAAGSADRIWMMWPRDANALINNVPASDLMLRGFDASGAPIGPEITLRSLINANTLSRLSVALNANHVLVSWSESNSSPQYRVFSAQTGAPLASSVLPAEAVYALGAATDTTLVFAQSVGSAGGIAWRLDGAFAPQGGLGGQLTDEVVAPALWRPFSFSAPMASLGNRICFAGTVYAKTWPEDTDRGLSTVLFEVIPGSGPLTTTAQVRPLVRLPSDGFSANLVLPLTDRNLLIGSGPGVGLVVRSAWR